MDLTTTGFLFLIVVVSGVIAVLAEHTTPEHSNLHNLDNLATLLRCSARGVAFD